MNTMMIEVRIQTHLTSPSMCDFIFASKRLELPIPCPWGIQTDWVFFTRCAAVVARQRSLVALSYMPESTRDMRS